MSKSLFIKFDLIKNGKHDTVYVIPDLKDYFIEKAKEANCPILKEEEVFIETE